MPQMSRLLVLACAIFAVGCATRPAGDTTSPAAAPAATAQPSPAQQLHALFDEYFEAQLRLNPLLATSIGDPRYEWLGPDLGMYQDPCQYFGRLEGELWRAIRLVVDTGLHSQDWTREQVLEAKMTAGSRASARVGAMLQHEAFPR